MLTKEPEEPDEFDFDEDEFLYREEKSDINDAADKIIENDLFGFVEKTPEEKPKDDDLEDAVTHVKKGEAIAGSYNTEMEKLFERLNNSVAGNHDYRVLGTSGLAEITEKRAEDTYEEAKRILEKRGYKDLLEFVPEGPVTPEEKAEVFGSPKEKPYRNLSLVVADAEQSIKNIGFKNKSKLSVLIYQVLDKLKLYPTEKLIGRQVKNLHKMQIKLEGEIEEYKQKLENEDEKLKKAGILMERYAKNPDSEDRRDCVADEVIMRDMHMKTYKNILGMIKRQYSRIGEMLDRLEDFNTLRKDFGLRKTIDIMRDVDKFEPGELYAP